MPMITMPGKKKPVKPKKKNPKKKKPFLRRVRERFIQASGGSTVATQEKQIRELGLEADDDNFKKVKPLRKRKPIRRLK